jgi:hypothetical protein
MSNASIAVHFFNKLFVLVVREGRRGFRNIDCTCRLAHMSVPSFSLLLLESISSTSKDTFGCSTCGPIRLRFRAAFRYGQYSSNTRRPSRPTLPAVRHDSHPHTKISSLFAPRLADGCWQSNPKCVFSFVRRLKLHLCARTEHPVRCFYYCEPSTPI